MFQLLHDLWQYAIGRGGGQDHDQLFAQIADQFENAEAGGAQNATQDNQHKHCHRRIEQQHQNCQLFKRAQAITAHCERNRAKHAERGQADDDRHAFEEGVRQGADQLGCGTTFFTNQQ